MIASVLFTVDVNVDLQLIKSNRKVIVYQVNFCDRHVCKRVCSSMRLCNFFLCTTIIEKI